MPSSPPYISLQPTKIEMDRERKKKAMGGTESQTPVEREEEEGEGRVEEKKAAPQIR